MLWYLLSRQAHIERIAMHVAIAETLLNFPSLDACIDRAFRMVSDQCGEICSATAQHGEG
jgi:hypothetical protein